MFCSDHEALCRREVEINGQYKGALTWAFLEVLRNNIHQGNRDTSYIQLLANLRAELEKQKSRSKKLQKPQKPQLSSSHHMGIFSCNLLIDSSNRVEVLDHANKR